MDGFYLTPKINKKTQVKTRVKTRVKTQTENPIFSPPQFGFYLGFEKGGLGLTVPKFRAVKPNLKTQGKLGKRKKYFLKLSSPLQYNPPLW